MCVCARARTSGEMLYHRYVYAYVCVSGELLRHRQAVEMLQRALALDSGNGAIFVKLVEAQVKKGGAGAGTGAETETRDRNRDRDGEELSES